MDSAIMLNDYIYFFSLIMSRYLGIFLLTPVLSSTVLLSRIKVGLAFFLAVITYPVIQEAMFTVMPDHTLIILSTITKELFIGVLIGFVLYIIFAAFQLAGQFIDLRMGFRIANVFDPLSGASAPIIGQFKNVLATLVFLAINAHLLLIQSFYRSFIILPVGGLQISGTLWQYIFRKSGDLFSIALKIALPVMGTIFVVDIILGFLARSVPQMNIFIIGFPVKIIIGFLLLILTLHIMVHYYSEIFYEILNEVLKIIKIMAPG